ncbi:MAG: hypothetical protein AAF749_04125 [Pseudomonadota bacterium]
MSVLSSARDREIGEQLHRKLRITLERLARQNDLATDRAADFLLLGAMFVAGAAYETSLENTLEIARSLVTSALNDDLDAETRH